MAWKEMTRNQKRMYRIHKQEEKINELQKRINKAIDIIEKYNLGKYDYNIPTIGIIELLEILRGK